MVERIYRNVMGLPRCAPNLGQRQLSRHRCKPFVARPYPRSGNDRRRQQMRIVATEVIDPDGRVDQYHQRDRRRDTALNVNGGEAPLSRRRPCRASTRLESSARFGRRETAHLRDHAVGVRLGIPEPAVTTIRAALRCRIALRRRFERWRHRTRDCRTAATAFVRVAACFVDAAARRSSDAFDALATATGERRFRARPYRHYQHHGCGIPDAATPIRARAKATISSDHRAVRRTTRRIANRIAD